MEDYTLSIAKAQLPELPAEEYNGTIEVVDKEEQVAQAVKILRAAPILGFDTETRPSFKRGMRYKVSLLQLATHDHCFLFRLNHISLDGLLKDLLEDENILKIGISLHDDFHNLNKLCGLDPKGFIDLQPYVKDFKIADNSLSRIYAIVFGKRISKNQRLTNWEAQELTHPQQVYASLDAKACISIYEHLRDGHFNPENSKYKIYPEPEPIDAEPQNAQDNTSDANENNAPTTEKEKVNISGSKNKKKASPGSKTPAKSRRRKSEKKPEADKKNKA